MLFSTTATLAAALLFATSTTTAIPIWSRIAALATRADPTTPAEIAQGSNFFFNSLRLEDACTPSQIGCISSQRATCSQEGNWEIFPCLGNTTCLAVPASDNTGVFVSCILFVDAQADIGSQDVSVDFGVQSPPNNTATAALGPATPTSTSTSDSSTPTSTLDASDPTPTSSDGSDPTPTSSDDGSDPTPTSSDDGSDPTPTSSDGSDPTPTSSDPNATCTDDVPEPEETVTEFITVIIGPNPTQPGLSVTTTLSPNADGSVPTSTDDSNSNPTSTDDSSVPTPTESDAVTGTDAATTTTSIPDPASATTCTQDPEETDTDTNTETDTEDPTDTFTESDPTPTDSFTDGISTEYGSAPPATDSADPTPTTSTSTSTSTSTTPVNNVVPTPTSSSSTRAGADVSVIGTHAIPAPSAPARMMRVRRA